MIYSVRNRFSSSAVNTEHADTRLHLASAIKWDDLQIQGTVGWCTVQMFKCRNVSSESYFLTKAPQFEFKRGGEGKGRGRTISTHTHRQTTSFYFWFKSRGYVHSTLFSKVKVPQVFVRLFPTTFMGEYLHVKDFLNPFKFSSWYLLQHFGYAVMCEWTCSRNRSAPAPALCYFDIDSDIFASQQRSVTKVTFCYEIWHT